MRFVSYQWIFGDKSFSELHVCLSVREHFLGVAMECGASFEAYFGLSQRVGRQNNVKLHYGL
jgi:hypothetical protein